MSIEGFFPNDFYADDFVEHTAHISDIWQSKVVKVQREDFKIFEIETSREIVVHPGAVGVIAVNSAGEFAFIKQFRRAIRGFLVEPVAGLLDKSGESAFTAAQRELLEEAGLISKKWSFLIDLIVSPGGSTEIIRYFLAEEVEKSKSGRVWTLEAEEKHMPVIWRNQREIIESILQGKIHNSVGISASLIAIERLQSDERIPPNTPWLLFEHPSKSGGIHNTALD